MRWRRRTPASCCYLIMELGGPRRDVRPGRQAGFLRSQFLALPDPWTARVGRRRAVALLAVSLSRATPRLALLAVIQRGTRCRVGVGRVSEVLRPARKLSSPHGTSNPVKPGVRPSQRSVRPGGQKLADSRIAGRSQRDEANGTKSTAARRLVRDETVADGGDDGSGRVRRRPHRVPGRLHPGQHLGADQRQGRINGRLGPKALAVTVSCLTCHVLGISGRTARMPALRSRPSCVG